MTSELGAHTLLYLALLILPISALIARRVPLMRVLVSLATWSALALLLLVVLGQREQFDPYLQRAARFLKLDDQQVVGQEVRIRMSGDGHFWVRARIDGVERRMLVDSGATVTALSERTAGAARIEVADPLFPMVLQTANGSIRAQTGKIDELSLGNIVARDLGVVVSPAFGDTDVLGMNFLSKLQSWRVEGATLVLVPHYPQKSFT